MLLHRVFLMFACHKLGKFVRMDGQTNYINNFVIMFQIFSCVSSVLKSDKASEVRQAAVLVITLVLRGLGNSSMKVSSG